jgi:hypothetical protein
MKGLPAGRKRGRSEARLVANGMIFTVSDHLAFDQRLERRQGRERDRLVDCG